MTYITNSLDECAKLWRIIHNDYPPTLFSDWEVRMCFQRNFGHKLAFVVDEENGQIDGILPLSFLEESNTYVLFPGETWHGRTWLEDNRIYVTSEEVLHRMLKALNSPVDLRYLDVSGLPFQIPELQTDEIGYLFQPSNFGFDYNSFLHSFPHRPLKKIEKELDGLRAQGVTWEFGRIQDIDTLIQMNISVFGADSYFSDKRFVTSFKEFIALLEKRGQLKVTTVFIHGELAAVDVGAVYDNVYTLLAGCTSHDFPGVAKLINMFHMERTCKEHFKYADFLCGDFGQKSHLRLSPRPLMELLCENPAQIDNETVQTQIISEMPQENQKTCLKAVGQ